MKTALPAAFAALLTLAATPVFALSLDPGQSGSASGIGIGGSGTLLASNTSPFYDRTTDAVFADSFLSSVTQTSTGQYVFTYTLSPDFFEFVAVPASLTLTGFQGVSTDIYVSSGPGTESTAWAASRSADGATLTLQSASFSTPVNPSAPFFTVEVRTNATGFAFDPQTYQPDYWTFSNAPPPNPNTPELVLFPTPAYAPGLSPAVPEPLALLTLPLALFAMGLRIRRSMIR